MLIQQFRHDPKSVAVLLTVALLHVALLYLLSMQGGLWIKPPHETQSLTVSFVTEHATSNTAPKKDTADTSHNAQRQQKRAQRSAALQEAATRKNMTTQNHQEVLTNSDAKNARSTHAQSNELPVSEVDGVNSDKVDDKSATEATDPASQQQKQEKQQEQPMGSSNEVQKRQLGAATGEAFSRHINPQYGHSQYPFNVRQPKQIKPSVEDTVNADKLNDEFEEYEKAVQNILADVDAYTTDDAGQAEANAKKDSNWGRLTSPEDSRVEALYKNRVQAVYPEEELAVGREGIVLFQFRLNPQGKVVEDSINVVSKTSVPFLREATIALLASEFQVTMKNGVLINDHVKIAITFSLDEFEEDNDGLP